MPEIKSLAVTALIPSLRIWTGNVKILYNYFVFEIYYFCVHNMSLPKSHFFSTHRNGLYHIAFLDWQEYRLLYSSKWTIVNREFLCEQGRPCLQCNCHSFAAWKDMGAEACKASVMLICTPYSAGPYELLAMMQQCFWEDRGGLYGCRDNGVGSTIVQFTCSCSFPVYGARADQCFCNLRMQ